MKVTRRQFLASAALATTAGPIARLAGQSATPPVPPRDRPLVVQVQSEYVVRGMVVHAALLKEMLEGALLRVTAKKTPAEAWQSLLRSDDVVGLKFNRSGAAGLGVSEPFADALIATLFEAGFERGQIVPIEAPAIVYRAHGLPQPRQGWDRQPSDFSSGQDRLASVLDQVTAIVNVPFLKTHNIAGVTCCLKNLSHALIRHPARFHGSHCSPYIADIVALPRIRDKLRLHLVNGLRVVFDRGPEPNEDGTWDAGALLACRDPVAADAIGLELINSKRTEKGLPNIPRGGPLTAYLPAAEQRGLGVANRYDIDLARIEA